MPKKTLIFIRSATSLFIVIISIFTLFSVTYQSNPVYAHRVDTNDAFDEEFVSCSSEPGHISEGPIAGDFICRHPDRSDPVDISLFSPFETFGDLVTGIINFALAAAGLVFFAMLIWGGIRYLSAQGDEKSVAAARKTITHALVGLLIIIAALAIIRLITEIVFGPLPIFPS